ncbi:hypothetical protein EV649_1593 [Kribbella sp. VKM Ac-2569]|uniref:hypothetical protein n=1 Tax=Kribbella sp. VKM Ac-2569 TaxID=2512220 RepID=UPI00102D07CB|nr:hypothetical protein [Kribbella sp. VKM Ac-2569]RZT27820.1 hypothetical protein EV649_1593 [Kribbella sp. VKM Ac-2569]
MRGLQKYWGWGLLAIMLTAIWSWSLGPAVLIAGWALVTAYFLFQVPVWCGAEGRQGPCRNNSSGILLGCKQVRQHKYQKLKLAVVPRRWRELNRGLWVNPAKCLASAGAVVGIVTGIVSTTVSVVRG